MNVVTQIPIQNVYYLLCYAWNRLDERNIVNVSDIESTNILDLFAQVLINGISHLLRRGVDRGYVEYTEDTRCLRGKILFNPTIKRNLLITAQAQCEFDELSHDVLHNQILKATIRSLVSTENLDSNLKDTLIGIFHRLNQIRDIVISSPLFSRVQLHRNNAFYDFLLKICALIHENLLITEETGKSKFRDFIRDERQMAYLFEEFVRNFYKIEAAEYKVSREDIYWGLASANRETPSLLPKMVTDISVEGENTKAVIDTKYYKEALVTHYDKEKIHSQHIFQIYAYLKNLEKKGGINQNCTGILLYPTVCEEIRLSEPLDDTHRLIVYTINLNQHWKGIRHDLLDLINEAL